MADREPTVAPTTPLQVGAAVLAGVVVSWVLCQALLLSGGSLPVLGPPAWLPMALLGGVIGWLAWVTTRTVQVRREPLDPAAAVTRVLLGKASVLAGAGFAAGYLVVLLQALDGLPAPLAQARVLHGAVAVVAAAGWAVAGWQLERACRIPDEPDDEGSDESPLDNIP